MFATQSIIRSTPRVFGQLAQHRNLVGSPPKIRISLKEKVLHGIAIAAGCLATPLYILVNLKHYSGK